MAKQGSMFRLTITILVILVVLIYTIFNTRLIIKGPVVDIFELKDGQEIESSLIDIKGQAKNISFISLNGRQIYIDKENIFQERILLNDRINPIEIYAKDKFGKEIHKKITLISKETKTPPIEKFTDIKNENEDLTQNTGVEPQSS